MGCSDSKAIPTASAPTQAPKTATEKKVAAPEQPIETVEAQRLREEEQKHAREAAVQEAKAAEELRVAEETKRLEKEQMENEAKSVEKAKLSEIELRIEALRLEKEAKLAEEARIAEEERLAKEAREAAEMVKAEERRRAKEARLEAEAKLAAVIQEERELLMRFYHASNGENWKNNENWGVDDKPLKDWHGVSCNEDGTVFRLRLYGNNLKGELFPDLYKLRHLTCLCLSVNALEGTIPPEWSDFNENISEINLCSNKLTGPLPVEWAKLVNLTGLFLQINKFSGELPVEWIALDKLESLEISHNKLSGKLPVEWGSAFPKLTKLRIARNLRLDKKIPEEWKEMSVRSCCDIDPLSGYSGVSKQRLASATSVSDYQKSETAIDVIESTDTSL